MKAYFNFMDDSFQESRIGSYKLVFLANSRFAVADGNDAWWMQGYWDVPYPYAGHIGFDIEPITDGASASAPGWGKPAWVIMDMEAARSLLNAIESGNSGNDVILRIGISGVKEPMPSPAEAESEQIAEEIAQEAPNPIAPSGPIVGENMGTPEWAASGGEPEGGALQSANAPKQDNLPLYIAGACILGAVLIMTLGGDKKKSGKRRRR